MRRLGHILLVAAGWSSLISGIAFVVLWWMSYSVVVSAGFTSRARDPGRMRTQGIYSENGRVISVSGTYPSRSAAETWLKTSPASRGGFYVKQWGFYDTPTGRCFVTPTWLYVAVSAACFCCFILLNRQRVFVAGVCSHCGYDLRATPERCPECGKQKDEG